MNSLRFTSLISTIADPLCVALATYLSARLPFAVTFVDGDSYGEREPLVDQQVVDLVWLCGLLYLRKRVAGHALTASVAPTMCHEMPAGKPVYYGDIIVRADSPYQDFAALAGRTWAYNEETSFSGYQMVRAHLAKQGILTPFFGAMVQSGAHLNAIADVREGRADCASIDSTVLQMVQHRAADQLTNVRTLARLGPYPMPLLAFTARCAPPMRSMITQQLLLIHADPAGQQLLNAWAIERFCAVTTETYAPITDADRMAQQLHW